MAVSESGNGGGFLDTVVQAGETLEDITNHVVTCLDWPGAIINLAQMAVPGTKTDRAWHEGVGFLDNGAHYYVPGKGWVKKVGHYLEKDPEAGQ